MRLCAPGAPTVILQELLAKAVTLGEQVVYFFFGINYGRVELLLQLLGDVQIRLFCCMVVDGG